MDSPTQDVVDKIGAYIWKLRRVRRMRQKERALRRLRMARFNSKEILQ